MTEPIKRLNYFDYQFLRQKDFLDEQQYHIRMRQLHNSRLHTWGIIAGGLLLSFDAGASQVKISEGMALDGQGQEIVQVGGTATGNLSGFSGKTVFITIAYGTPKEADLTTETQDGQAKNTRWLEIPEVGASPDRPADESKMLILGQATIDANGVVTGVDMGAATGRRTAGVVAGDLVARSLALSAVGVADSQSPVLRQGAPGRADLAGGLRVSGALETPSLTLTPSTAGTAPSLSAGAPGRADLAGSLSVTGNIDVAGRVDGRDVSTDGSRLDQHLTNVNTASTTNPHRTTAADVGALPTAGGSVGGLTLMRSNSPGQQALIVTVQPNATAQPTTVAAALNAVSGVDGVAGLFVRSTSANSPPPAAAAPSLRVDGNAIINGNLTVTGSKGNYVVDTFINASGQPLHTGDVVRLKGTPVAQFYGLNNKIPLAEVTLADKVDDSLVIGIVDQEALPLDDAPDTRTEPDDPTSIADGGALLVVTLGAYAHCKVDASAAPIEVGDPLTSSASPGCARKATEPKIGSIIGKALEPLKEGTGYIAVFVNIQ
ncbi:MAG TPA: hypothetical protein VF897_24320 [Roseiflexaceae bacterium]